MTMHFVLEHCSLFKIRYGRKTLITTFAMTLKFAANLNFLFTENTKTIAERLALAKQHGFRAVELPYPDGEVDNVIKAKNDTGLEVSLVNLAINNNNCALKFGTTSVPCAEECFRSQLKDTIKFAKAVKCKKIHLMAGIITTRTPEDHLKTFTKNLKCAAAELAEENMIGLIEPISSYAIPRYFLSSYELAEQVIECTRAKNIKIMVDIFHLQHIRGNIINTFGEYQKHIGHIQIAQVPDRHEPDCCGELNFGYIFKSLEMFYCEDWVGLEYKPKSTTVEGLQWLDNMGYTL